MVHTTASNSPLVFISAAEPSADLHAAHLIAEVRRVRPEVRFVGVAGPRMVAAGCERIYDMTAHASMLLGALANVGRGIAMLNAADLCLRTHHFDAAVVVDSPTLHLPLAGKANALGIPVLYYIAPQMWAWGRYRIYKLRHRTAKVACILPFEAEFFRDQGIDAEFVGHPLAEQVAAAPVDQAEVARLRQGGGPLVALLPGSRKHVVGALLPDQLVIAQEIAAAVPRARFGVSVAGPAVSGIVDNALARAAINAERFEQHRTELLLAADLVIVASGTAALEVAFHRRPMIVMYKSSPLFYHALARWMLATPYLSLPNILAGREIVPEFMPYYRDPAVIARRAVDLLTSPGARESMVRDLAGVVDPLQNGRASVRTSELLLQLIDGRKC